MSFGALVTNEEMGSAFSNLRPIVERLNDLFYGVMGALDGIAIRIRCPQLSDVPDPGNYDCQKEFYALNMQAIVDKDKQFRLCCLSNKQRVHSRLCWFCRFSILWIAYRNAWRIAGFGTLPCWQFCILTGSFLAGTIQSARVKGQAIHSEFKMGSINTYCAVAFYVKSAFGELIIRWGIFWRMLQYIWWKVLA